MLTRSLHRSFLASATALALVVLVPSVASPQDQDEATTKARNMFEQGVAAMYAGKYDAARMAFERASKLRPSSRVTYNLGLAELQTGRFVDAARHIAEHVRQTPQPTREEREALAKAERYVAHLVLRANVDGARVYVDDEPLGRTPVVIQPVYVLAGRRKIRATLEGFADLNQVYDLEAGKPTEVNLVLDPLPPSVASGAGSGAPPQDAGAPSTAPLASPKPSSPSPSTIPSPRGSSTRTAVLATESIVGAASLAFGVVYALKANSARDAAYQTADSVESSYGSAACVTSGQVPLGCSAVADRRSDRDRDRTLALTGFVAAGVLGAATIATYFLWPPSETASPSLRVDPIVGPNHSGMFIHGQF